MGSDHFDELKSDLTSKQQNLFYIFSAKISLEMLWPNRDSNPDPLTIYVRQLSC